MKTPKDEEAVRLGSEDGIDVTLNCSNHTTPPTGNQDLHEGLHEDIDTDAQFDWQEPEPEPPDDENPFNDVAVNSGTQIDSVNYPIVSMPEADEKIDYMAYRKVTSADVQNAIEGTALGEISKLLSGVCNPPLPVEITLPKGLTITGCALTGRNEEITDTRKRGVDLCRVKIGTAGGQGCNIYSLVKAPSGVGKNIGNLEISTARNHNWYIGAGGSAEGLADAYKDNSNGMLVISEFSPYLDNRTWQHKASGFMTEAFNNGWFVFNMSNRKGGTPRSTEYCFPNIIAYIQPDVFLAKASPVDISSGFLGRFLISEANIKFRIPSPKTIDTDATLHAIDIHLAKFLRKKCVVAVPDGYLPRLREMFENADINPNLKPSASRLVNEYGARIATMLSIPAHEDISEKIVISDETWERTAVIVQWYFGNAERSLGLVNDYDYKTKKRLKLEERILTLIRSSGIKGCNRSYISHNAGHQYSEHERNTAIAELCARGVIECKNDRFYEVRQKEPVR